MKTQTEQIPEKRPSSRTQAFFLVGLVLGFPFLADVVSAETPNVLAKAAGLATGGCKGVNQRISVGHSINTVAADATFDDYGIFVSAGGGSGMYYYDMTGSSRDAQCLVIRKPGID